MPDGAENALSNPSQILLQTTIPDFVDYNWDISKGCPSFVTERPGDEIRRDPSRLRDIKTYVANLAAWLSPSA